MKALVIGASGFIGQSLMRVAEESGKFSAVAGAVRGGRSYPFPYWAIDLLKETSILWVLAHYKPDVIFHLGAVSNIVGDFHERHKNEILWKTNVDGTRHLLTHARQGCRFVFASSATVYGDLGVHRRCRETDATSPISLYGASKLAGEALVGAATALGQVRGVSLRLVANCGPGATHGLVRAVAQKLRSDSPALNLLGDAPGTVKPFVHMEDAAQAFLVAALSDATGVYNVGPDDTLSVAGVARAVMGAININKPIIWGGEESLWAGDQRRVQVSGERMRGLGWEPKHKNSEQAVYHAAKEME